MAVIVLGHADLDGKIDLDCIARLGSLNELDQTQTLILAGGSKATHPVSEAQQMRELVQWTGPVVLEEYSRTTAENAWCTMLLVNPGEPLTIVCSRAQAFRAWLFYRLAMRDARQKHQLRFHLTASPSLMSWLYEMRWLHHAGRNRRTARERAALMAKDLTS